MSDEEYIPQLVSDEENHMLAAFPSLEDVKAAVFGMNKHGAPSRDDFGVFLLNLLAYKW